MSPRIPARVFHGFCIVAVFRVGFTTLSWSVYTCEPTALLKLKALFVYAGSALLRHNPGIEVRMVGFKKYLKVNVILFLY